MSRICGLCSLLTLLALYTAPVFAGSCNLASLSIANRSLGPLTWSAGIDSGTVASISSTMAANLSQPIQVGHQVNVFLTDDDSEVRGYVNVYDAEDQLIATLMINFSDERKECKLLPGYKNVAASYDIRYEPSKKPIYVNPHKAPANVTYLIEQHQ